MKEMRSRSQVLFGFLPEQTVDLKGRVWKVDEWPNAGPLSVDAATLQRELISQALPWEASGIDGSYVSDLRQGRSVRVLCLDTNSGVRATPFPKMWMCKKCQRLIQSESAACKCGNRTFGQLPFVAFHDACGMIDTPWIPRCPQHQDVRVHLPGTARAEEIIFDCPECKSVLRRGFGFAKCLCGKGRIQHNVHRAASVFTPRGIAIVNSPSRERVARLTSAGGPARALSWVLDGMATRSVDEHGLTPDALAGQLRSQGLSAELVEQLVSKATASGELAPGGGRLKLPAAVESDAEHGAVQLALATCDGRHRVADLVESSDPSSSLGRTYREEYASAMRACGLEAVELVDAFPVLTGNFAYSRGDPNPGTTRLVPFRDMKKNYVVYAESVVTEALLFRLRPSSVATWLRTHGQQLGPWSDERGARLAILQAAMFPNVLGGAATNAADSVTCLVHSLCHRIIRRAAAFAGIERNSLSELLVPHHLAFFVFAQARGDFILGGLQAVFETELHHLLSDIRIGEHRCPLDPGCRQSGGACVACLHIGEPSCRLYNRALNRQAITSYFESC